MWIKNLRQRKLQTLLIFLIIAVCTALLSGAVSILTSLDKPCKEFARTCNAVTAKIYPYSVEAEAVYALGRQFEGLPGVRQVDYARSHYIDEAILLKGEKAELFADLTEYNDAIFGAGVYLEGDKSVSRRLADNECILPACISNEYDMHVGDQVVVKLADKDAVYRVAAVYTDPFQTSTAFDSDILINKLPQVDSNLNIYVYGKEGVTGKQIEEAYLQKYEGIIRAIIFTLDDRINNGLIVGRIIGALFLAIGIVMLLVSALMIHYMVKNVMLSDAKTIAVYKTMGYTSNDILLNYLKLYFLLVTAASLAGITGSVFISDTILTSVFENMGQLKVNHSLLSGAACYLVTVSFVITVITVIIAKTRKIKPVHSLSGMDYGGIKKRKQPKGNSSLQFSSFGIAYRNFIREKRNAASIFLTCIVTVFSVNFIVISLDVANSMKENNDFWLGIDKSDVMVNVTNPENFGELKAAVNQDTRVDHCLYDTFAERVTIKWEKGMDTTFMSAFIYEDFDKTELPVTQGHNPEAYNEIAISTSIAGELHKEIGDYLEVYLKGECKVNMLITGLFQSYMQMGRVCRLTSSAYTENNLDISFDNISVYLKDNADSEDFIKDIKEQIGSRGNVIKRTEQYESIMDMIVRPQQKAIPQVAVLILIIAGLNIFCIVYFKNLKSRRSNCIYKCIGYTAWHLVRANLYFVTAISAAVVLVTVPVSMLAYSPLIKACLSMFHFIKYPLQYDIVHLLLANAAVILVFILSTLISSKALFKVNARELIQE